VLGALQDYVEAAKRQIGAKSKETGEVESQVISSQVESAESETVESDHGDGDTVGRESCEYFSADEG